MNPMLALPFALALATAVAALIADGWVGPRAAIAVTVAGLGAAAVVALGAGLAPAATAFGFLKTGGGYALLQAGCFAAGAVAAAVGAFELKSRPHGGQVAALLAFSAVAAAALIGATELVGLLIALESIALLGYALVASSRTHRADETALKYFVQGSVAAALLVYGLGILLAAQGDFVSLSGRAPLAAAVLLAVALAFKLGAFPFHTWVPDTYEAAPLSVAAYLSSAPKLAAIVAIPSLFDARALAGAYPQTSGVFAVLAAASLVFGNLAALRQSSFSRLLGYSAVAGAGYALVAMVSPLPKVWMALFGVTYALAAFGAFAAAQAVRELVPEWDGSVRGLAGLGARSPMLAGSIAALMLSLTGIPLTVGFWGKLGVFLAAIRSSWSLDLAGVRIDGTTLALLGMLGSVVSFGYYGSVLRAAFLEPPADEPTGEDAGRRGTAFLVAIACAAIVLALGVAPFVTGLPPFARALALP